MSFFTPLGEGGKLVQKRAPRSYYRSPWPRRILLLTLATIGLSAVTLGMWRLTGFNLDRNGHADSFACPDPQPASELPPVASKVKVNVYNGTPESGLASVVAEEMARRGFQVLGIANDPLASYVPEPFELRAGPKGAKQLEVVAAHAPGGVVVTDRKRKDATVDLVVGDGFTRLADPEKAITALSGPQGPPGIWCPGMVEPSPVPTASPS
ncbi:MAG: LytR C-terminal domain-containing protein [Sporichthyaceae bacterium]|nr:LytR C-terminal domain-containing protein [Sporichthyaceae bacterium]